MIATTNPREVFIIAGRKIVDEYNSYYQAGLSESEIAGIGKKALEEANSLYGNYEVPREMTPHRVPVSVDLDDEIKMLRRIT